MHYIKGKNLNLPTLTVWYYNSPLANLRDSLRVSLRRHNKAVAGEDVETHNYYFKLYVGGTMVAKGSGYGSFALAKAYLGLACVDHNVTLEED